MSSVRNTHWCYRCRRPTRLQGRDAVCQNCNGGFVQELDDMVHISPLDFFGPHNDDDHDRRFGFMEAFSAWQQLTDRRGSSTTSCPVCRQELHPQGSGSGHSSNGRSRSGGFGSNTSGRESQGRRNPFSSLWPFRSSSSSSSSNSNPPAESSSPTTRENSHQMGYSGWPFE
ncbi:hypothetical protein M0R45_012395 [Rubus argutus]|uniref:RING-type E3 ubiquitin transferase n=1 Tax=Rubus argutus TaxID=59490 RepID=A0AAW1YD53_RUBAR